MTAFLFLLFTSWSKIVTYHSRKSKSCSSIFKYCNFISLLMKMMGMLLWSRKKKIAISVRYNIWIFHSRLGRVTNDWWNPTCQRLFKFQHTRELVMKSSFSQNLHQTLAYNPYIKSHKNIGKWLNIITIKFDTELKPTKNIVINQNLQNSWL